MQGFGIVKKLLHMSTLGIDSLLVHSWDINGIRKYESGVANLVIVSKLRYSLFLTSSAD